MAWLRCILRGHHDPVRNLIGGFRCRACGTTGADLEAMGFEGSDSVGLLRHVFTRKDGGIERTSAWPEERQR